MEASSALWYETEKEDVNAVLNLRENCTFVYGGDVFDRGPGDIRIAKQLVALKRRYPERVFLLIGLLVGVELMFVTGNRDLNKMKLTSELEESCLKVDPQHLVPPYWFEPESVVTFHQYLQKQQKTDVNIRIEKLKWMLIHTMGSPKAFEFRRQELSVIKKVDVSEVILAEFSNKIRRFQTKRLRRIFMIQCSTTTALLNRFVRNYFSVLIFLV